MGCGASSPSEASVTAQVKAKPTAGKQVAPIDQDAMVVLAANPTTKAFAQAYKDFNGVRDKAPMIKDSQGHIHRLAKHCAEEMKKKIQNGDMSGVAASSSTLAGCMKQATSLIGEYMGDGAAAKWQAGSASDAEWSAIADKMKNVLSSLGHAHMKDLNLEFAEISASNEAYANLLGLYIMRFAAEGGEQYAEDTMRSDLSKAHANSTPLRVAVEDMVKKMDTDACSQAAVESFVADMSDKYEKKGKKTIIKGDKTKDIRSAVELALTPIKNHANRLPRFQ